MAKQVVKKEIKKVTLTVKQAEAIAAALLKAGKVNKTLDKKILAAK